MPNNLEFEVLDKLSEGLASGNFDRYRVLGDRENGIQEKNDYRNNELQKLLVAIHGVIHEHLTQHNIWFIFNYYSLFLDMRIGFLRMPGQGESVPKPENLGAISWYGIFGSVNRNSLLKLKKGSKQKAEATDLFFISDNTYGFNIPIGNGWNSDDIDQYNVFIDNFKRSFTRQNIKSLNGTSKPYLDNQKIIATIDETSNADISESLFSPKKLTGWDECLIFSNKYAVDFADSLDYFPNFLFFKEHGEFTVDDLKICTEINKLCVKVSTRLMVFENELLIDRLEDLVDSKPNRIFDILSIDNKDIHKRRTVDTTDDPTKYAEEVTLVFNSFIENHIQQNHPIMRNDLVAAFYLYWTDYFKTPKDSYLKGVKPWPQKVSKDSDFHIWLENQYLQFIDKLKVKYGNKYFDFKQFIFDCIGEKSAVEFEMVSSYEVIGLIKAQQTKSEKEEFVKIYICNSNSLSTDLDDYKSYLVERLLLILEEMSVTQNISDKNKLLIDDGSAAADYFSVFCLSDIVNTGYKYIYYIPSVNYDGSSSGGFSFFCKNKWPRSITKAAQDWATRFGTAFSEIEAKKSVAREILKHGTKAAITAIMSRNLSHNIGSHVLSYFNQELTREHGSDDYSSSTITGHQRVIFRSKELFQYIQHRMDFLAEISTSIPCSEVSLDIGSEILKPVFKNEHSVLLEYIAKSENIDLRNKICIEIDPEVLKTGTRVAIPNGLIGLHAIYSILENFIRNAAKHYKSSVIQSKNEEPFIKIVVRKPDNPKWANDYLVVRVWDMRSKSCNHSIVKQLRDYLPGGDKYSFTNRDGIILPGAWGIKEMVTSANFLRKNEPDSLINPPRNPELIDILCGDNTNGIKEQLCSKDAQSCSKNDGSYNNKLGIRFYLHKPKDLLIESEIVIEANNEYIEIEKDEHQSYISNDTAVKDIPHIVKEIPHKILLVSTDQKKKLFAKDTKAPCRILVSKYEAINDSGYLDLYKEFIETEIAFRSINDIKLTYDGEVKYRFNDTKYTAAEKSVRTPIPSREGTTYKYILNKESIIYFAHHLNDSKYKDLLTNVFYLQPISGGYSTFAKMLNCKNIPSEIIKELYHLEMIEAAFSKVVIVDERMSEWAGTPYAGNLSIRDVLHKMNIHVVNINLNRVNTATIVEQLDIGRELGFDVFSNDNTMRPHFFIIHQGVLDKLVQHKDTTINEDIEFLKTIKCTWKIVDSGRGVPTELHKYENIRFVEISALQKMLENFDKHGLIQTLFSLRKPHSEKL